jgi:hypothetical protein
MVTVLENGRVGREAAEGQLRDGDSTGTDRGFEGDVSLYIVNEVTLGGRVRLEAALEQCSTRGKDASTCLFRSGHSP